jgi:beta-glucanase (GH16 family)
MKRFILGVIGCLMVQAVSARGAEPAADPPGWKLVWSDEFEGAEVDAKKWDFERGTGFYGGDHQWLAGWGNNELEFYTGRPENVFLRGGVLHLRAVKEDYKGAAYTSARLMTRKKDKGPLFNKRYGKFEFRAKLPLGKGVWPAVWMLPQEEAYGPWAASGEIDILEARGQEPAKVLGTLHYGSRWPSNAFTSREYVMPEKGTIAAWHVYGLEWEPGVMRWLVDGKVYATQDFWWSCGDHDGPRGVNPASEAELNPWPAPFDKPFYFIINLAVGGNFLGNPDATTVFPAEMEVDYLRVYDKVGGYGEAGPRGAGKLPFEKKD